jgi:hypothetical protein
MKKIVLALALIVGGWWYFIGGRTLTEEHVREFYAAQERATLSRDPKALCALLAADFETTGTVMAGGRTSPKTTQNREQVCAAYDQLYASFEKIGDKMGGMLQLDSSYTLHDISLASNKKMATVDVSSALDVGGTIMNIRSRATETLIRRNGKTLLLRSEGTGSVRSGG